MTTTPRSPGWGRFAVVLDENNELMTFTLDHQDLLCLIYRGSKGHNELVNLSQKFGFSAKQTIRTLATSQNVDGTIHLVFSLQEDGKADQLYVLCPMSSRISDWTGLSGKSAFYTGPQWDIHIREILLGSSNDSSGSTTAYPQLHLVIKQRALVTEDISVITVNTDAKSWSKPSLFKLPTNTDQIISKCVGNLSMFRGMYVLYKESTGKVSMRFVGLDPEESFPVLQSIAQIVPEGATQIASFDNADGLSDLLIAGKQLSWLSAHDGIRGLIKSTTIDESNAYASCTQLQVSNATNGVMTVRSLVPSATPTSQDFVIPSNGAPTKSSEAMSIPGQDKTSDSFAVVVSRAGPGQSITNTFISRSTVDFMFEELEALAHAPEIAAAREKYINHFESMLSFYDQLDAKLATCETASQAADTKLTNVYNTLDTHLTNIKIAKTTGDAVAIIGGILCFTPAALIGAGLVAAGTATSVGAGALGDFLFEHNASEEFGSIMGAYNSASKGVVDTFDGVEKTKKDMADSLAELIKLLRTWPMPQAPPGSQTQMNVPGKPKLPDVKQTQPQGPNGFSQAALRGLSLSPSGLKSLEEILAKSGGKAAARVAPFLGRAVPVVGMVVDVVDIVNTWTNSNETLEQANQLKSQIKTNTTTLRDAIKTLKSSLESQIGSLTVLENLRKLLRIRKSPPGRDPPPPPLTPQEVCKITNVMKSMVDTTFVVIAQLASHKPGTENDNEPAEQYWAEFIPKPTVLQLSQSAFTAPVVDSVYDMYQQPPPKAEDKDKDEQLKKGAGFLPAPQWFINDSTLVYFGDKQVYNAAGTQHDTRAYSWIQFWYFFTIFQGVAGCVQTCQINLVGGVVTPDTHDYYGTHCKGGHMEKVVYNGWHYILPICGKHNAPGGFYDRLNGRWMLTLPGAVAVRIQPAAYA